MSRYVILNVCLAAVSSQIFNVSALDNKIVGGKDAFIEEYPYQASMQYKSFHYCGAVIISKNYVVTAAHCTIGTFVSDVTVRAGTSFRNTDGVIAQISAIFQHPKYEPYINDYDISILQLATLLTFGPTIAPITLAKFNEPIIKGQISHVTGWGALKEGGSSSKQLQVVEVPIISLDDCKKAYNSTLIVTDRMFCAGVPEGGKDSCQGDSGGPLAINGTLFGLVSFGVGCARPDYPGVYASIPALRNYISEITGL